MFLTKLSTTICVVALAAALVLGASPLSTLIGASSEARAQDFRGFLDEFDNGSATDGNPVKWVPFPGASDGNYPVEQESFVLRPNQADTPLVAVADGISATNVSIRTQVRVDGGSRGTAVFARLVEGDHTYQGGVETDGSVYIGWNGSDRLFHYLGNVITNLRPNQEEVMLQFDVFDDQLEVFAWRASDSMPSVPTVRATDSQFPGPGQIALLHHPIGISSGAFRFVQASPAPIPEPSSIALGSLGFVALAGFVVRARLQRVLHLP